MCYKATKTKILMYFHTQIFKIIVMLNPVVILYRTLPPY